MKRFLSLVLLFCPLTLIIGQQGRALNSNCDSFKFSETEFDFGDLTIEQLPISHEFQIYNLSDSELVILYVCSICPCITTIFDREPICKDSYASIIATFNGNITMGDFNKSIVIYLSNQEQPIRLKLTGRLIEKRKHNRK